jgi:uncharacterized protein YdeI (YjbR/CyaY-like superfamily)
MTPLFFANTSEFRAWLEKNHQSETEVFVGYYKVHTKKPTMNWSESVDEALCFGWIDGIRRSIDEESYCNRFTPRNPRSNWSAVNIKKVEELIERGKMTPAGLAAFEKRTENKSAVYSYENRPEKFDQELETRFQENPKAWEFFLKQAHSYRKTVMYWVMSAKQKPTQLSRLEKLIAFSESGKKVF